MTRPSTPAVTITATSSSSTPPTWAKLQRELFDRAYAGVAPYMDKYTREDGTLIYRDDWVGGRDGLDDLYESFYNFPLLYLLGGDERLLPLAHRQWEAITRQGADFGLVSKEYEVGYDQFHQSEGNLFFYFLCAADPHNETLIARARRFAGFYMNEDPEAPNYDPEHNIIRAVHNGSKGPRWGYIDSPDVWSVGMQPYGLAFDDLPGITTYADVINTDQSERAKANRLALFNAINDRMGRGDSVANLPVTSLVTNAYLMTGDVAYRDWVRHYTGGWWARAEANDGIIPDNVGLNGEVGEYVGGRWYGAAYGWSWPHGYDSVIDAATVAALNATLLTGDTHWLDLPGRHFDMLYAKGRHVEDFRTIGSSISNAWVGKAAEQTGRYDAYVMPKRIRDSGWFDYQTIGIANTVACWSMSFDTAERDRLADLAAHEPYDWAQSYVFHSKGDDSHDRPWLAYLDGRFPDYPETILTQSLASVDERLQMIADDRADLSRVHIHHWQQRNPVTTEALIQLTLGAPQALYNGGSINSCFRYFDLDKQRPGLPADVSALVSAISRTTATLHLVNLSAAEARRLVIQGGFYGEHRMLAARVDGGDTVEIGGRDLVVVLPAGSEVTLEVSIDRLSRAPRYRLPDFAALDRPKG